MKLDINTEATGRELEIIYKAAIQRLEQEPLYVDILKKKTELLARIEGELEILRGINDEASSGLLAMINHYGELSEVIGNWVGKKEMAVCEEFAVAEGSK